MADNVAITAGTGTTVATDDVGGVQYQRVKVAFGADGSATDASSAAPLPAATPSATVTGTITAANATPTAGAGTANSSVTLTIPDNHSSVSFVIGGTFSATTTLGFQTSIDGGATWFYTNARRSMDALGVNETISTTSTDIAGGASPTGGNPSFWRGTTGSSKLYRVTCISYTAADAITVTMVSSAGIGGTYLLGSIPAGTSNIGVVTDKKDSGRTQVSLYATNVTAGTSGSEALVSMTISKGLAAPATATTYAITAGKTLRINGFRVQHSAGAATANSLIARIRVNTAGAAVINSTVILQAVTRAPATVGAVGTFDVPMYEGFEIPNTTGTTNVALTVFPTWTTTALTYDLSLIGYEY